MLPESLQNKRIGIVGFGVNNRALTRWLVKHGARDVVVYDENPKARHHGTTLPVEWVLGQSAFLKISADIIFRSPGIPLDRPEIVQAREQGIEISSQTELFLRLCPARTIGVTGTKGKGTTSTLIANILKRNCQLPTANCQVYLAGNIGRDPFEFFDELTANDIVVLELSSFQLEGIKASPNIAVVLGITADHLDYHHTLEAYQNAKTNLVRWQCKSDFAILNLDSASSFAFAALAQSRIYYFSVRKSVDAGIWIQDGNFWWRSAPDLEMQRRGLKGGRVPEAVASVADLKIPGPHNLINAAAAITCTKILGVENAIIRTTLSQFKSLPHRLEKIGSWNGVTWYDDSASTNASTAQAALDSFSQPKILIAGGSEKLIDYNELGYKIAEANVHKLIIMGATGPKIAQAAQAHEYQSSNIIQVHDLEEAVREAKKAVQSGFVVILSPASASFDQFTNYAQRGEIFQQLVRQYHQNKA